MNHKNARKFAKAELKESISEIENPGRGWYRIYTFLLDKKIDIDEIKWCLSEEESLALVLLDIHAYRSKPLDEKAIHNSTKILRFFKKYEKDVILRVVYDRNGNGKEMEPDSFSLICQHLKQICNVLKENKNSVFLFQGLLIGSWGEMHDSKYLDASYLRVLWQNMNTIIGEKFYFAVRTPAQWRTLISEEIFQTGRTCSLGIFDDGILGSLTHLGTFGTMCKEAAGWEGAWTRNEELDFVQQISEKVPCGGEIVDGKKNDCPFSSQFVIEELRTMQLSYLNSSHDMEVLNQWKKIKCDFDEIWNGQSLYSYIGAHLGYRFLVKDVDSRMLLFRKVQFAITIENVGFGRLYEEAEVFLEIIDCDCCIEIVVPINLCAIKPGSRKTVTVVTKVKSGKVYLKARRKKDNRRILFGNENIDNGVYIGCL